MLSTMHISQSVFYDVRTYLPVFPLGAVQNSTSLRGSLNRLCVLNVNKIPLVVVLSELNTVKSVVLDNSTSTGSVPTGGVLDGKSGSIGSEGKLSIEGTFSTG